MPRRHPAAESGAIKFDGIDVTMLDGHSLAKYRRDTVGIVFQAFNLVPSLTALENVMVPLRAAGMSRAASRRRAEQLLTRGSHRLPEIRQAGALIARIPAGGADRSENLPIAGNIRANGHHRDELHRLGLAAGHDSTAGP